MANILDLPVEIFQKIIHELVDSVPKGTTYRGCKIGRVWRLRSVCRTFAAEIERNVLSQQPKGFYRENRRIRRLVEKCFPRYIKQVSRKSGSVNEGLLTRLQRMADYIVEGCKNQKRRADIIEKTYAGLFKILNKSDIMHALWCDRSEQCKCSDWDNTELPVQDKLCAAIAVGAHGILPDILLELNGREKDRSYRIEPLWFALQMNDLDSLNIILRYLEKRPSHMQIALTKHLGMFDITKCIKYAACLEDYTAIILLLTYHQRNLPSPSKDVYNGWVSKASKERSVETVRNLIALIAFDTGAEKLIGRNTIVAVCANGNYKAILPLLQHIGDINTGTALTAPIFIAVRSGHPEAIVACFKAGANVDLVVACHTPRIGKTHITPLDLAMHRQLYTAVLALLLCGAEPPSS